MKSIFTPTAVSYDVSIAVETLVGTFPADPRVKEKWVESMFRDKDEAIAREIAERMMTEEVDQETAEKAVVEEMSLIGFRGDENGLYLPRWSFRAMLLEGMNIIWPKRQWKGVDDVTKNWTKLTRSWGPEHLMVNPARIYLPDGTETETVQRFTHGTDTKGQRYHAIAYDQTAYDVPLEFTVELDRHADGLLSMDDWTELWTHCERFVGVGGQRKAGSGRFVVTKFDRQEPAATRGRKRA